MKLFYPLSYILLPFLLSFPLPFLCWLRQTQGNFEQTIRNLEFSFSFESPTHNNDVNIAMLCFA
jgi:hypothetical protein